MSEADSLSGSAGRDAARTWPAVEMSASENCDLGLGRVRGAMIGGLPIVPWSRRRWAAAMVWHCLQTQDERDRLPVVVFSANGQVLAKCRADAEFRRLMLQAQGIDADGQSLVLASRLLIPPGLPERVATTDLFHDAARAAQEAGLSFYLLGGTQETLGFAVPAIRRMYPTLNIVGYEHGYFQPTEEEAVVQRIVRSGADVLWVGLGVPLQEGFVIRHREALRGVAWVKTCGGLFDYFRPDVKRAPLWMQSAGLEWLFRTMQAPGKYLHRYLTTNFVAAWLLLTQTRV